MYTIRALVHSHGFRLLGPRAVRRASVEQAPTIETPAEVRASEPHRPVAEASPRRERTSETSKNYQIQSLMAFVADLSGSTFAYAREFTGARGELCTELKSDAMTAFQIRIAEVQFGGGRVVTTPFTPASDWDPKDLLPRDGDTPLGQAIGDTLKLMRDEASALSSAGVPINRKIVCILTDGAATDSEVFARQRLELQKAERDERLFVFPIALGQYVPEIHTLSCKREAAVMKEGRFRELFSWIADLLARVSRSQPGDEIPLGAIDGWARMKG